MDQDTDDDKDDGCIDDGEEDDEEGPTCGDSDSSDGEDEIDEWLYGEDDFDNTTGRDEMDMNTASISPLKKRKRKKKKKELSDVQSKSPRSIEAPSTPIDLKKRRRKEAGKRTIMTRQSKREPPLSQ